MPEDFNPPREIEGDGFVLVPLDTNVTELDFKAYMSSIQHLQDTFSHSTSWPREGLTMEDAVKDMENEQAQFEERKSFPYAVLDANRTRERGCVYVRPSKKEGYDAVVRLWVTAEDFEQGFDSELFAWTQTWVEQAWPARQSLNSVLASCLAVIPMPREELRHLFNTDRLNRIDAHRLRRYDECRLDSVVQPNLSKPRGLSPCSGVFA